MYTKKLITLGVAAAIGIGFAGLLTGHRKAESVLVSNSANSQAIPAPPTSGKATLPPGSATDNLTQAGQAFATDVPTVVNETNTNSQIVKPTKEKPPIQDPDARAALSLVGADPEAENYWASAINNPNLPAEERKDLIEDLNEDGLSDPHHPGPQDMPLIWNRIQIIEELAPNAMDQVNADAFAEAYKDLLNLADGKSAD